MPKDNRRPFDFRVTYFTVTGSVYLVTKWTTATRYGLDVITSLDTVYTDPALYPIISDAVARLRGLRDTGCVLPGLETATSPGYPGAILVEWPDRKDLRRILLPAVLLETRT